MNIERQMQRQLVMRPSRLNLGAYYRGPRRRLPGLETGLALAERLGSGSGSGAGYVGAWPGTPGSLKFRRPLLASQFLACRACVSP